jgi:HEAT repeat protein
VGLLIFSVAIVLSAGCSINHEAKNSTRADSTEVRAALAKFEKDCPPPTSGTSNRRNWQTRMECLVTFAKAGSAAVPILIDTLENGAPYARSFAAQALGLIGDPRARPALIKAMDHTNGFVRYHCIRALGRIGGLEATPKYGDIAENDDGVMTQFEMTFALKRDDEPKLEEIRRALAGYDLKRMDSARLGKPAPEFALTDAYGNPWALSQFRGKKSVLLTFLQHTG